MFFNKKQNKKQTSRGASLAEVMIAIAVFTIGIFTIALFIVDILQSTQRSQDRNQGILIAQEGIEAVISIRDNDGFSSFYEELPLTKGLDQFENGWIFSDLPSDTYSDFGSYGKTFNRSINLSVVDDLSDGVATSTVVLAESVVWWESFGGTATTTLKTYLTNWER
jgi:hypothetical protein